MAKTILVVDDKGGILDFMEEALDGLSYEVLRASNGKEALETLKYNKGIEGIFTDCTMPEMDGLSLIKKVRELGIGIPIIAMTGDDRNIKPLFEAGAQNVLKKPFNLAAIKDAIEIIEHFKQSIST